MYSKSRVKHLPKQPGRNIWHYLTGIVLIAGIELGVQAQAVRVLPLGNSITYDENSGDGSNPRPIGDRISYRYRLYQLLTNAGYVFDYVGSENSGNNYFQNPDMDDNAGFPGIETWQLEDLINTGYNAIVGHNESPGPYLQYYPADVVLLHIGTNNLITSAYQVSDLLDRIRVYLPNAYILVARIINRRTYDPNTTIFNNNVAAMVAGRGDPKMVMVDMENGAGINYADEMADNLHPNQAGFDKMANQWFDAIQSLNQPPVIDAIPEQITQRQTPFQPIVLDDFVTDGEDSDNELTWSFTRKLGSQLIVNIDANRILTVSPNGDWYGSELLTLKVTDTGNGAFPATTTTQVRFTVEKGNDAPIFESNPSTQTYQDETYTYTVQALDLDGDSIIYSAVQKPSWLTFNAVTHNLHGVPGDAQVGFHDITLRVSDGQEFNDQAFQLEVINVNDPPYFVSTPPTQVDQGTQYSYVINAQDPDGDQLTYTAVELPSFLQFNAATRVVQGTPVYSQVGEHTVTIKVSDGVEEVLQSYVLEVLNTNNPPQFQSTALTEINEDGHYYYYVIANDIDGDQLTYSAPLIPDFLNFDPFTQTLTGQPDNSDVGPHSVILRVTDGYVETDQAFTLTVINVNDPPEFTTEPIIEARAGEAYVYHIEAKDVDVGDVLTFTAATKPDWLILSNGVNDALLYGQPIPDNIGSHAVIIQVSDGKEAVMQGFTLKVLGPVGVPGETFKGPFRVYPNPARDATTFQFAEPSEVLISIYDSTGKIRKSMHSEYADQLKVDLSDLNRGTYLYRVLIDGQEESGTLIKY